MQREGDLLLLTLTLTQTLTQTLTLTSSCKEKEISSCASSAAAAPAAGECARAPPGRAALPGRPLVDEAAGEAGRLLAPLLAAAEAAAAELACAANCGKTWLGLVLG